MAKKIDKDKLYSVFLKERCEVVGRKLYPGRRYFILGKHLEALLSKGIVAEWQEN